MYKPNLRAGFTASSLFETFPMNIAELRTVILILEASNPVHKRIYSTRRDVFLQQLITKVAYQKRSFDTYDARSAALSAGLRDRCLAIWAPSHTFSSFGGTPKKKRKDAFRQTRSKFGELCTDGGPADVCSKGLLAIPKRRGSRLEGRLQSEPKLGKLMGLNPWLCTSQ